MSLPQSYNLTDAVSGRSGPLSRTFLIARVAAISVAIVGAMPTAMNLYQSWLHGIPYSEVSHRLSQYDLWVKNFECKIDYRALNTGQGTRVDVGACPKSGDIAIKISSQAGKAAYEWIPFDTIHKAQASLWPLELLRGDVLVGTAHASEVPAEPAGSSSGAVEPRLRLAQATGGATGGGMQTVCEALQGRTVVRIVNDGGKCYREMISPYQGKVEKREEVACTTSCKPGGK